MSLYNLHKSLRALPGADSTEVIIHTTPNGTLFVLLRVTTPVVNTITKDSLAVSVTFMPPLDISEEEFNNLLEQKIQELKDKIDNAR